MINGVLKAYQYINIYYVAIVILALSGLAFDLSMPLGVAAGCLIYFLYYLL